MLKVLCSPHQEWLPQWLAQPSDLSDAHVRHGISCHGLPWFPLALIGVIIIHIQNTNKHKTLPPSCPLIFLNQCILHLHQALVDTCHLWLDLTVHLPQQMSHQLSLKNPAKNKLRLLKLINLQLLSTLSCHLHLLILSLEMETLIVRKR